MPPEDSPMPSAAAETILWSGHTSQWVHFWYYFFCILLAAGIGVAATMFGLATAGIGMLGYLALIIPLVMWLMRWWVTKCTTYELTTQRLRIRAGILNKKVDELELFRVRDYTMEQPFLLRMVGLGNLTMITSDATTPTVVMRAIPGVENVREKLRNAVQNERDRKRVRQMDVDSVDDHPGVI
ncbi:MAG: PH domain-containing protein [Prosthecobacter sp.]|uniref:PH domain-containing protein n=1 Tax=Prosthecobacter sp. TaxID=1965333 RepID=UPI00260CD9BF|nr:PH domain-containing protein [Prosthecobacter sp.]MCF7788689.1 PH domain-containing protein [Prosthecobacter sp.]